MDRKLLERMVGAAALVLALVVLVPALLDGNGTSRNAGEPGAGAGEEAPMRTVTLDTRGLAATRPGPAATVAPGSSAAGPGVPASPPALPAATAAPSPAVAPPPDKAPPAAAPAAPPPPAAARSVPAAPASSAARPTPDAARAERVPAAGAGWAVQLGVFSQRDNADRLVRELRGRGFEAFISPVNRPGSTLYRVRVGPERDRDAAQDLARRLAAAGHAGPVVPM